MTEVEQPWLNNPPLISIVVPTRNEKGNVAALVERLAEVLAATPAEVIFVDDSTDETPAVLERLAATQNEAGSLRLRVVHRPVEKRTGLGTAVADGFKLAEGGLIVVMDADLQHPPELIGAMVDRLERDDLDLVVASRYLDGGSPAGLSGPGRRFVAAASRRLSQALFREARKTSDPHSGYFICRRSLIDGVEFRTLGFKILLEILVCVPDARVGDVPLRFQRRHAGESNASVRQGIAFLEHLYALVVQVPGSARFWKYAAVGGSGLALFLALLAIGRATGLGIFQSWGVAFAASLALNWQLNRHFTFVDIASPFGMGRSRPVYLPVALLGGVANLVVFAALAGRSDILLAGLAGAVAAMAVNYLVHRGLLARPAHAVSTDGGADAAIVARVRGVVQAEVVFLAADAGEAELRLAFPSAADPPLELLRSAAQRRPVIIAQAPSHIPQPRHDIGLSAWLGVPVLEVKRYVGLLVAHRDGPPFTADDLDRVLRTLRTSTREARVSATLIPELKK